MGTTERREREREEMRKAIVDAAAELYMSEGYESISIRNIAEKIEYTPGAIYSYFKDKDEIVFELHLRGFDKLFETLKVSLEETDPLDKLYKSGQLYIKFALENPEYYDLMFISRSIPKSIHEKKEWACGARAYNVLYQEMLECISAKLLPLEDPHAASYAFWSLVHGMVALVIRDRCLMCPPEQAGDMVQRAYDFMWAAVRNRK